MNNQAYKNAKWQVDAKHITYLKTYLECSILLMLKGNYTINIWEAMWYLEYSMQEIYVNWWIVTLYDLGRSVWGIELYNYIPLTTIPAKMLARLLFLASSPETWYITQD